MIEAMHEEFVTMARMKGLSEWRIVIHHAARNSLLPVLTAFALAIGPNISANVVVETVFSWPGLGRLLVQAVSSSDYPLAQGAFFLIALVVIVMNFVADLLYGSSTRGVAWPLTAERRPHAPVLARWLAAARDVAAPPLRDPYTVAGLRSMSSSSWSRCSRMRLRPMIRRRSCSGQRPLAANARSGGFILGTTNLGRDIYSQLVYGSRSALMVGLTAAVFVVAIGTLTGLVSGYFGGLVDAALMRLADIALAIPFLPFVIVLAAFLRPSTWNVVIAVALLLWPNTARVIRSQVLTVRERAYVEAARVTGGPRAHPVRACGAEHPAAVLPLRLDRHRLGDPDRGGVSFVGFGDPSRISWGSCCRTRSCRRRFRAAVAWFLPPGFCIVLVVVAGSSLSRRRGGALPEAAELTRVAILAVDALVVEYRTRAVALRAVDGASFEVPEGRRRPRRRVRVAARRPWPGRSSA